jgi:hypothetical protein
MPEQKEKNREKRPAWKEPQWWQVWIAAILVPVGIYALWIYYGQLEEMRKSTQAATASFRLAKESSNLDQRAWVAPISVTGKPEIGQYYTIRVEIKNIGKTFARKVKGVAFSDAKNCLTAIQTSLTKLSAKTRERQDC